MQATLHTPVCDLLGCTYPVILAGMGGPARSELVAAVTNAGGFGFLGMVRESPELIASEIAKVRERTDREFGVNLIPAATKPELLEAELAACIAAKVPAMALFWDLSADIVKRLRGEGILVACQVGDAKEAEAAARRARARARRMRRRSRSLIPPQMPNFSPLARANSRQSSRTTQPRHTSLASRVDAPRSGKNRSGSTPRQFA